MHGRQGEEDENRCFVSVGGIDVNTSSTVRDCSVKRWKIVSVEGVCGIRLQAMRRNSSSSLLSFLWWVGLEKVKGCSQLSPDLQMARLCKCLDAARTPDERAPPKARTHFGMLPFLP